MIYVHTDAAFDPNTHLAGLACTYLQDGKQFQYSQVCQQVWDNHYAEFLAVAFALDQLEGAQVNTHSILVYTDSKLVVQTIEKNFVKDKTYQTVFHTLQAKLEKFPTVFFKWIPEKENQYTDKLAKACLRQAKQEKQQKR